MIIFSVENSRNSEKGILCLWLFDFIERLDIEMGGDEVNVNLIALPKYAMLYAFYLSVS